MISFYDISHVYTNDEGIAVRSLPIKEKIPSSTTDINYVIPAGYEGRPDLISRALYNSTKYWELICIYNNIKNPMTGLEAGKLLVVPSYNRVRTM